MAENLRVFTDQNWEAEVLRSPEPVLVDFWAEWCVPCRTLEPAVEAVARQFGGRLRVGKLNVEENADVPYRYSVTTLPTLILFKSGTVAEQRVGLLSRDNLVRLVESQVA